MPTLQQKRGTSAALAAVNPTPLAGEIVWVSDTNTLRVGDGTTAYSSLAVISATPTSHSHGNITNAGAIGSTANLPIITTTSGVLTTGSFGTTAATFCQGNDSRLSDTRTPTDNTVSTAKLQDDAVTYAKIQNVSATDRLLGRSSAGAGDVEEVICTAFGRSLIDDADAAAARTTLSVQPTASPAFTGTVSAAAANFTGAVSVTSPLTLTGTVAGNARALKLQTSGSDRWQITPGFDAESGSNAGSTLWITRWSDAGAFLGTPISIARATGVVTIESGLIGNGSATFNNTGNVVPLTVTNTGTANSFVVNDASGDPTPFVIDASGNVGIKATSTASSLNVVGNSAFYQDANGTPSLGSKSFYAATFENFSAGYGLAIGGVSGATGACIVQVQSFSISAAYDLLLQPLGGNVGIGTTTPGGRLEVAGGQLLVTAGSGSSGSYRPGVAVSGDDDTGIQQIGGSNLLSVVCAGVERVRFGVVNRTIIYGNGERFGLGVSYDTTGGSVYFGPNSNSQTPDAAISGAGGAILLLAKNDGEVLVGGTTDQGAYNLQCNGTGVWGAGAYVNGSDERIKDEIAPIDEATSVITAMQPVTFRYKPTWSSDQSIQPGFIAQQLQEALAGTPYLDGVVQQGTEYLSVAYQSLIPLLVKALQESNARIAALEEKINA